jgi:putative membrane protein
MLTRRTIVVASAGLVMPAAAQTPPNSSAAAAGNDPVTEAVFVAEAISLTSLSLLTSQLAEQRNDVPKLKRFADLEVAEQSNFIPVLLQFRDRARSDHSSTSIPADQLEGNLNSRARRTFVDMRGMTAGSNFSRTYFLLQSNIHQQLLNLEERYLKSGTELGLINIVKLSDVLMREHLALLLEIKTDMTNGVGAVPPGKQ